MGLKTALSQFTHAKIFYDQPMKKHTGFRVGGVAKYYAEVDSLYGLNQLIVLAKKYKVPYKVLGNGTNVLVSDKGYNGIIVNVKKLNDVFFKRDQVRAMAGAQLDKLVKFAFDHRLSGIECLVGIPATVGGAIVMNAGAFGHNIAEKVVCVETLENGKIKFYDKEDCKFGYRTSRFQKKGEVIISATFSFEDGDREQMQSQMKSYLEIRKSLQPCGNSCGSVFKNPKPVAAGALIDRAGLKGFSIGCAKVSERHGNFIITNGKGSAEDVFRLINSVKYKVKEKFNVELVEEVEFLGEF